MPADTSLVVRRFLEELWDRGNLDAIDRTCSANLVVHDPNASTMHGREAYREFAAALRSALADMEMAVEDVLTDGDRVAVRWVARGSNQGAFLGAAATGRPLALRGIDIYRIARHRIEEIWTYYSALGALRQMGAFPPAQAGAQAAGPA